MPEKNEKIFLDYTGTVLKVGDHIMYVTDGPTINYGIIRGIKRVCPYGYEHWSIKVWKEKGNYLTEPRYVVLTEPTVFKCGVELSYPTSTVVEGT